MRREFLRNTIWFFGVLLCGFLFLSPQGVWAQQNEPDYPIYIVQSGDSVWGIAQRFGVSVDDLTTANDIADANQLDVGMELKIPGLQGVRGRLVTRQVHYGETLRSLSRRYQMTEETLARLNRLVSPLEMYAGATLILVEEAMPSGDAQGSPTIKQPQTVLTGESLLEFAARNRVNPWEVVASNQLKYTWQGMPADPLLTSIKNDAGLGGIPYPFVKAGVYTLPLGQGKTTTIRFTIDNTKAASVVLSGTLAGNSLHFSALPVTDASGTVTTTEYIALQGLDNMIAPGFYPLAVQMDDGSGNHFSFSQMVYVADSQYQYDPPLQVTDEDLLNPALTQPEEDQLKTLASVVTQEKYWTGGFRSPVDPEYTDCWPSTFGRRRSYNGSDYTYIHNGLDFCGQVGFNIYAPAKGKVVFTGELFVRGNTTVIDHGWGVYTVYAHQDQVLIKQGDMVDTGQKIGLVGKTGRVTGPHLHWEVWAGDVRVDPYDWLLNEYPQSEISDEVSSGG